MRDEGRGKGMRDEGRGKGTRDEDSYQNSLRNRTNINTSNPTRYTWRVQSSNFPQLTA
jgi:hypothetical protein